MTRAATARRGFVAAVLTAVSLSGCIANTDEPNVVSSPAVAPSAAATTATAVLAEAAKARLDTTAAGDDARAKVYSGPALESANALAKALAARTDAQKAEVELSGDAKVVAVSTAPSLPQQVLVQTTKKKSGDAVLVLLQAEKAGAPFRIVAETPMLPGAKLDALDPTTSGSAPVKDTAGLAVPPQQVVKAFADSVAFPNPKTSKLLAADALSDQLRASAAAQAKSLGEGGVFTQVHEPGAILGGLKLKGGKGAVVFALLVRDDRIAMRHAVKLTPAKDVTAVTGVKLITTEAELTSNEIIAFVIPTSGKARVVAASDQLVDGTGR